MSRKLIVSVFACATITVFVIAGYFFYGKNKKVEPLPTASVNNNASNIINEESIQGDQITDSATKGTIPSIQTNPLEEKPDLNPVEKTNPYTNIKTNPFK